MLRAACSHVSGSFRCSDQQHRFAFYFQSAALLTARASFALLHLVAVPENEAGVVRRVEGEPGAVRVPDTC